MCLIEKEEQMKRRRSQSRDIGFDDDDEEEESEEECCSRRLNLRKRKRPRYVEDGDEEEEDKEDEHNQHNQKTQERNLQHLGSLDVTCGTKKGILYVKKLARGEPCIQSAGRWFTPSAFEDFGGKASAKRWKTSIVYEEKPLQFWLEQGYITTKGYHKGGAKIKPKQVLSSTSEEEDLSEVSIQSAEDSVEKDSEDEDASVADTDRRDTEERKTKSIMEECRLKKLPKVILKRLSERIRHTEELSHTSDCTLSEAESDHETISSEDPVQDSCCDPEMDECEHREEERESNTFPTDHLSIAAAPDVDLSQMSDPLFNGGIKKENREELMQSEDGNDDRRVIKTETFPYIPDRLENTEELEGGWREHLDMSKSKNSGQPCATRNRDMTLKKVPYQKGTEEEITEPMSPIAKPLSVVECFSLRDISGPTCVTSSDHNAAQSQVMKLKTSIPQTTQASDCAHCSNMDNAPLSRVTESSNVDTMELDQLKREKLKMQVKVLKLQEEYYTLRVKELKKLHGFT